MLSPMSGRSVQQQSAAGQPSPAPHPPPPVSGNRQKLDAIRHSLQPFQQKWEEEEDEDEDGVEDQQQDGALDEWRADLVRQVVAAGYDRESAYYALRLVNFESVLQAVEVLSAVKKNLVRQHNQQSAIRTQGFCLPVCGDFLAEPSTKAPLPPVDPLMPPADPCPRQQNNGVGPRKAPSPRASNNLSPGQRSNHHQQHALRHSQSFDPADVMLLSAPEHSNGQRQRQLHSGTVIKIGRNQSERIDRKEPHPLKRMAADQRTSGWDSDGRQGTTQQVRVLPACTPSSSALHSGPLSVQRIFVDPRAAEQFLQMQPPPNYGEHMDQVTRRMGASHIAVAPQMSTKMVRSVSPLPESIAKKLKTGTYERVVKPCRAPMFRFFMEQHVEKLIQQYKERNQRAMQLTHEMEVAGLAEPVKEQMLRLLRQKESKYIRLRRQKINRGMFDLIRHIGIGAFGKVTLVRKKDTDQVYAMKTLVKADVIKQQQAAHVKAERDILAEANSPWIVKLFFSFQDVENLYFIMEYVPGGDMMQLLINMGVFPESLARFYIAELSLAVEYVHSLGFIHRDIKPDNILIDKGGHIKLTDFGLCTGLRWTHDKRHYVVYDEQGGSNGFAHLREDSFSLPAGLDQRVKVLEMRHHRKRDRAHSVVGTGNYMAPEVVQKIGHTQLCDWWSVGVILYEMVFGRPPFMSQRDDPAETQFMIVHWRRFLDLKNPMGARLSRQCVDCVARLCCDQESRMGHRQGAKDVKAHAWFKGIDFASLRSSNPEYVPRVQHPEDTSNFDTFEVRSDELMRGNGNNGGLGGRGHGPGKPFAPNFIDFTFRHFFSDQMGAPGSSRPAQSRPSLAPLIESAKEKNKGGGPAPNAKSLGPSPLAKKSAAPPIPQQMVAQQGNNNATIVQIGQQPRRKTEFRPFQARLEEEEDDELSESEC